MRENECFRLVPPRGLNGKLFLSFTLIFLMIFFCACGQKTSVAETANENASVQPVVSPEILPSAVPVKQDASREVEFKGVKFRSFISQFSTIEMKEQPAVPLEDENNKPDSVESRSAAFGFGENAEQDYEASLGVYPVDEFRQAFAVSKNYVEVFDAELANLKKVIAGGKATTKNLPELHLYDRSPVMAAKLKPIRFKNGTGIFFLTQYTQEGAAIVNNQDLLGVFQGLTSDGKYYVSAYFPLTLKGLPDSRMVNEFQDYKMPADVWNISSRPADSVRYKKYVSAIEKLLNQSAPEKFTPNLSEIEKTISSLEINGDF